MDGWYFSTWRRLRTRGNHALESHDSLLNSSAILAVRVHKQLCLWLCVRHGGSFGNMYSCTATSWMKIYHCMYKYTLKHVYIYISDNIWYIWKYVCMVLTYIALYWHELQISMEHRIHRCIAFASAFWCATPVLKSRVNSLLQSSQSDTNCHGGFIHSDFNKGNKHKTMQNDTKPLQSTLIYITNTMDKVHPASQWINHRPTTVSSLRGKYLSHRDMCPAAALRQLHWWLHPLSRPGLRCHRNEIAWKCLTWKSIAVGWTWI